MCPTRVNANSTTAYRKEGGPEDLKRRLTMAILAIFKAKMTKGQYDDVRNEVNWTGDKPDGAVFHAASFDDDGGIHVADVWASPEALDSFVGHRLMPVMQKHGILPPEVAVYPVHQVDAFPSVDQYKV
jgi:hypothetical protein